jgi:hypothetical protein
MTRPSGWLQWQQTVSTYLPHLSHPQLTVLVLWSFGIVLAQACGLTTVAVTLAYVLGCSAMTIREQRRAWYRDAQHKSGAKRGRKRRSLEVTLCFAPLLGWVVAWTDPTCRQLALAMDASTLGQRFTLLSISVVVRGCAIPVAWRVVEATRAGAWRPPLGSPLWPLTRQCARRLDRDCAGRPGLVGALAVYHDSSPGLASLLTDQSPRPLSCVRLRHLSAADPGGQPRGAAVGGPRDLLCHPRAATRVHPARAGMRGIAIPGGSSPTCRRPPSMSRGMRCAPGSNVASKTANAAAGIGNRPRCWRPHGRSGSGSPWRWRPYGPSV